MTDPPTDAHRGRSARLLTFLLILMAAALLALAGGMVARLAGSLAAGVDPAFALRPAPAGAGASAADSFPAGVERLDDRLEPIRAGHRVPALAVAIVCGDSLCALGVVGVRRAGRPEPARWNDRFHIGSDTKAMTATVAAMLIDEGRLRWGTTLAELFPELGTRMRPEYRGVTVELLMHHRSGLPDDRSDVTFFHRMRRLAGTERAQRMRAVEIALARAPAYPPGTKNVYANMNFNILGTAIERITGDSWESQVRRRLYEPLGMRSAGFGSPNTPGRLDQPWGHRVSERWPPRLNWIARTQLPVASAASGNVSLSMRDWARFASLHLRAARGDCRLLACPTFSRLHEEQPPGSHFAAGWGVARDDSIGTMLQHAGSDGWWYAAITIAPERDRAILIATNVGGERAEEACEDAYRLAWKAAFRR